MRVEQVMSQFDLNSGRSYSCVAPVPLSAMRLSIATETGDLRSLSLPPSLDLPSLAVLVASELSLPADSFVLLHNGRELSGASVAAAGVVEDDILLVKVVKRQRSGGEDEVERVRRELLADAGAMQRLARVRDHECSVIASFNSNDLGAAGRITRRLQTRRSTTRPNSHGSSGTSKKPSEMPSKEEWRSW